MSDREKYLRTNQDFSIAFTALWNNAKLCGVDMTQEPVRKFIEMQAEASAQNHAEIRYLRNLMHKGIFE